MANLEVVGIKSKEKDKLGKDWTSFEIWYEQKLEDFVNSNPNTLELLKIQAVEQYVNKQARWNYRNRSNSLVNAGLDLQHPIVQFFHNIWKILDTGGTITDAEQRKRKIIYNAVRLLPDDKRPKVSYNVGEQKLQLTRKYPMLEYSQVFNVGYWSSYHVNNKNTAGAMNTSEAKKIAHYVQLVDAN